MSLFRAAAIQMTSGDDIAANIAAARRLIEEAVAAKAEFIALPENAFYMRREGTVAVPDVPLSDHPAMAFAQEMAQRHAIWLLIGSLRAREVGMEKAVNRSVLVLPSGAVAATYDKLHLFDVTLANGQRYHESSQVMAGHSPVLVNTPLAAMGLSICYDVRFPGLYRALALSGAEIFTVPSAFTRPTGEAHWHTLLRARAIENACYVIAPAQCGAHPGGRETYGHSLIIDPWGKILAERTEDREGVITAMVDTALVAKIRAELPVLTHHRVLSEVTKL